MCPGVCHTTCEYEQVGPWSVQDIFGSNADDGLSPAVVKAELQEGVAPAAAGADTRKVVAMAEPCDGAVVPFAPDFVFETCSVQDIEKPTHKPM